MKILLVKPPNPIDFVVLPIGLGYIASYLKSRMAPVELFFLDCPKESYHHKDFERELRKTNPDVLGVTAMTMEIESAFQCCEMAKKYNPAIATVIGGPHATCAPENVLTFSVVDFIFRGEAEKGFYELIQQFRGSRDFSRVPNLGYKEDGHIHLNPLEMIDDLDELPFPDYELMKFWQYPKTYKMKYHPSGPLITSRGCPFPCTYCAGNKVSGKKFRARKPEFIIDEIKLLKDKYRIKQFVIWDDNFTLDKKRAHHFCDLLLEEHLNLPWWCANGLRIETLDEELIRKMKAAGLYAISLGIESGSEKIQRDMKKNLNFAKVREIIDLGNKYKIRMEGYFILGYPTESREDILKTIRLMKELPLKRASIMLYQPLVGSESYENLEKQGRLKGLLPNRVEYSKPSVLPDGLENLGQLKKLQRKAILEFYIRPRVLFTFIKENFSLDQVRELWNMVRKYLIGK